MSQPGEKPAFRTGVPKKRPVPANSRAPPSFSDLQIKFPTLSNLGTTTSTQGDLPRFTNLNFSETLERISNLSQSDLHGGGGGGGEEIIARLSSLSQGLGSGGAGNLNIGGSSASNLNVGGNGVSTLNISSRGASNMNIGGSGASNMNVGGSGTSNMNVGGSGTSHLNISGSGASNPNIGGSGASNLNIGGSGASNVDIGNSGTSFSTGTKRKTHVDNNNNTNSNRTSPAAFSTGLNSGGNGTSVQYSFSQPLAGSPRSPMHSNSNTNNASNGNLDLGLLGRLSNLSGGIGRFTTLAGLGMGGMGNNSLSFNRLSPFPASNSVDGIKTEGSSSSGLSSPALLVSPRNNNRNEPATKRIRTLPGGPSSRPGIVAAPAAGDSTAPGHDAQPIKRVGSPKLGGSKRPPGYRRPEQPKFIVGLNSLDLFMSFVDEYPDVDNPDQMIVDTSEVLSRECYEAWINTRRNSLKKPEESFRRALTAHVTGADRRRPFVETVERSILAELRKQQTWACFDGRKFPDGKEIKIGEQGFRTMGYFEKKAYDSADAETKLAMEAPIFNPSNFSVTTAVTPRGEQNSPISSPNSQSVPNLAPYQQQTPHFDFLRHHAEQQHKLMTHQRVRDHHQVQEHRQQHLHQQQHLQQQHLQHQKQLQQQQLQQQHHLLQQQQQQQQMQQQQLQQQVNNDNKNQRPSLMRKLSTSLTSILPASILMGSGYDESQAGGDQAYPQQS